MATNREDRKYLKKRIEMIEDQIKTKGITDLKVINAMSEIPREIFVPPELQQYAYQDGAISIGEGQTISQPYMVAIMTECLELGENDKVLEIGTGSGYQMAVLLKLTPNVYSIERLPGLFEKAVNNLKALGHNKINIKLGDGSEGWEEEAPFDAIIVTSGAPFVPEALKLQLAEGGRLVIPAGSRHIQTLYKLTKIDNSFHKEEIINCVFVPLIGKYGWDE
jgi:protein-L-isoaspartate(D-aspartate) O-methyltransferase